jgi:hypothetical protein
MDKWKNKTNSSPEGKATLKAPEANQTHTAISNITEMTYIYIYNTHLSKLLYTRKILAEVYLGSL